MCPYGTFGYIIKPGDTFYNLAKQYDTTVKKIMMLNPTVNPYNLKVGQLICIPYPHNTCPIGTIAHVIVEGDTLWDIAQFYGTTVDEILDVNPNINPYNLMIGQKICIPTI